MKRTGIFGGSFSPPHKGHFQSAMAFYDDCALDELLIIPAGIPPHKSLTADVTPEMRLAMTGLAFAPEKCGNRRITVCDYELKKPGSSFTYETLLHFSSPENTQLYLLVGSDMFLTLHQWKHPEILSKLATVVLHRREQEKEDGAFEKQKKFLEERFGMRILCPVYTPLPLSSRFVREKIKRGENAEEFLDVDVEHYIQNQGLYGSDILMLKKIKKRLRKYLSDSRLEHVCSVEEETALMTKMYGITGKSALDLRKAALLHDITHEKTKEEQQTLGEIYGLHLDEKDLNSPAVLHQFTGACVAADMFDLSPEGVSAIFCHTTGKAHMSVGEKILYLADFIERKRPYENCRFLREKFYKSFTNQNRERLLDECVLWTLESTMKHLKDKGTEIHPLTFEAYRFLKKELVNYQIL